MVLKQITTRNYVLSDKDQGDPNNLTLCELLHQTVVMANTIYEPYFRIWKRNLDYICDDNVNIGLDDLDKRWICGAYRKILVLQNSTPYEQQYEFSMYYSLILKYVLQALLMYKYTYLEKNLEPYPCPPLPDPSDETIGDSAYNLDRLDPFYSQPIRIAIEEIDRTPDYSINS